MGKITWLHISDLHFDASQTYDANIVLEALLHDIAERIEQDNLPPDFIAVTGDIAFSGRSSEYVVARQFFDELLLTTGLGKERLFLVPGNHDVDREAITFAAEATGEKLTDRDSVAKVLTNSQDRRLMFERFRGYAKFIRDYLGEELPFNDEHYFYVRTLQIGDLFLGLLGLNSAWLSASESDRNRLILGERQVRAALEATQNTDLRLALVHHPFDWLQDFDREQVESLLGAGCDFVLHGHMHRSGVLSLKDPDIEAMIIGSGASYGAREYPNAYNFVCLDPASGTGTIYLRRYSDARGGFWAKDTLTYKNVPDGEYSFRLSDESPVVFDTYAQAPVALSRHIRLREFEALVADRTKRFVGREFIFQALDEHLRDHAFPSGYLVLIGEPGIGKTALMAQLVKQKGYVHHFNIAAQNIRTPREFLGSICAQLIIRYGLDHYTLSPEATQDSGFLSQLLSEAAANDKNRPVVILVDALDEAEDIGLAPGANRLYLPLALPEGVYFVVTTRPEQDYRLRVDRSREIYLDDRDPQNLKDVMNYIREFVAEHQQQMDTRIEAWGLDEAEFVEAITDLSEGNFMYLVYVLGDIREEKLTAANVTDIRKLPRGLRDYYKQHWRVMRAVDADRFDQYYEPVICILATVREPVPIADVVKWTKLSPIRVKEVIDEWLEFLNVEESTDGESLYRIYHASFQDFLKEEVGLSSYHDMIAVTALSKIPGFLDGAAK